MALIAALGFAGAAAAVGALMVAVVWWLSGRYFGRTPASMGLLPDGEAPGAGPPGPAAVSPGIPGVPVWRGRRFVTLAAATSLGLFAQIGLIAHLFSLLVPALGPQLAGFAAGLATACAIAGRTGMGWLLPPDADRRRAAAASYGVQLCGSLALMAAGGTAVPLLLLGIVLFGLGLGNATSLPPLIVQQDFAPADTARAVALVTACSQACYAFAPAAFGVLRDLGAGPGGSGAIALFAAAAAIQLAAAGAVCSAGHPPAPAPPQPGHSREERTVRTVERLFCGFVRGAWIVLLVGRWGDGSDVRQPDRGGSGEACRALMPDRTVLPRLVTGGAPRRRPVGNLRSVLPEKSPATRRRTSRDACGRRRGGAGAAGRPAGG